MQCPAYGCLVWKNNSNVLEAFNKPYHSPSAVLELLQSDRTDKVYMTGVFLQIFAVTRRTPSVVL